MIYLLLISMLLYAGMLLWFITGNMFSDPKPVTTANPPAIPFCVTKLKLSNDVWYSGYFPYLVLKIDEMGKSTPGELYCLSSEPLSKNE